MAPANTSKVAIPPKLPFSVALSVCSDDDFKRLACAFLSANSKVDFDHHKAAREYGGPAAKGDSFKRQIWVISKKIHEAAQKGGGEEDDHEPVAPKKSGAKKRKASGDEDVGEDVGSKKKAKGRGKKGKGEVNGEDADVAVKPEDEDGDFLV